MDPFFAPSIDSNIAQIDLHGIAVISQAIEKLESEMYRLSMSGASYCEVIHGIGSGKLEKAVHGTLKGHPLVRDFQSCVGRTLVLF
ncbi:Smr/MutS family protein [Candidatus Nomurabacteria bacterium]|nr:Smr/MutS family protein [Candidatus Nomurabacteria bacterium]